MADVIDIAQEHAAVTLEHYIMAARRKTSKASSLHCESCGLEISQTRRAALPGVSTCYHCQTLIERREIHFKGGAA